MRVIPFKSVTVNSNDTGDTVELSDMIPSTSGADRNKVSSTMVDLDQCSSNVYDSYNAHELKEPLLDDGK
jgi:hypothetical protein